MQQSVTIPELFENEKGATYSFSYLSSFIDRIFYSECDSELTNSINQLDVESMEDSRSTLAGDLDIQKSLTDKNAQIKVIGHLKNMLTEMLGSEVEEISITHPEDPGSLWINHQQTYEHNPTHNHTGLFSFVWYLDVPEEIRWEHKDQNGTARTRGTISFQSVREGGTMVFSPKTNDIFIFDARQPHQVYPFYTKGKIRKSMAGNIHYVKFKDGIELGEKYEPTT